ncbi:HAD family hydrolase [Streptomyces sp. NBC_01190]|uniref:HAD family hydrolase n=1 Tax=Streptomyces sp. NBC_01190 TaxID=2903767 RepID=UPI00386962B9|nr:HAD-IA family hydrolase [Streptomyces sp. NBC_01190]
MPLPVIWFDFGGVLSPPQHELFAGYERRTGIGPGQLQEAFRVVSRESGEHAMAALETGRTTEAAWGRRIAAALAGAGVDLSRARWESFGEQWFAGVRADPAMLRAVSAVRTAGHRVGVLSNNVREWEPYWRRMIEPAGPLDFVVDSSVVGLRKPQPEIYRLAEAVARAEPADCVLVDDLAANCAAARTAGWRAVDFRSAGQGLPELGELLGLPGLAASCLASPEPEPGTGSDAGTEAESLP